MFNIVCAFGFIFGPPKLFIEMVGNRTTSTYLKIRRFQITINNIKRSSEKVQNVAIKKLYARTPWPIAAAVDAKLLPTDLSIAF